VAQGMAILVVGDNGAKSTVCARLRAHIRGYGTSEEISDVSAGRSVIPTSVSEQ